MLLNQLQINLMDRKEFNELMVEENPSALFADGFDNAIIGHTQRMNHPPLVAYSVDIMIDIMIERDNMTFEEALEFFDFNIGPAWLGEGTPMFIRGEY